MKAIYNGASDEQVKWGANDDPRGVLTEGKEYEVLRTDVHTWHTKYILADYPALKFNSVCFEKATNDD